MAHIEDIPTYHEATAPIESARVPPPLSEHVFRHKELSVNLSSYARSPESTPVFYPSSSIEGTVVLTLPKPRTPSFIRITVQCGIDRVNQGFRNRTDVLSYDLARFKAVWSESITLYSRPGTKGLPAGAHIYPFRFDIPKKVKLETSRIFNNHIEEVDLPPNFIEAGYPLTIQWILLPEVKYGSPLKMDRDIPIRFRHMPITRSATHPSPSIQSAYLLGTPMPTPADDPEGFFTHSVVLAGTLFGQQFILQCQISLTRPLVYASNTRIPYFISISPSYSSSSSQDTHAASLLLLSRSTTALLSRKVDLEGQIHYTLCDAVVSGRSWNRRDGREAEGRMLQGEIEVPGNVPTDFTFPAVTVSHAFELLVHAPGLIITTIEPPAITPPGRPGVAILSLPVKLVNATMSGVPKPPSYAPAPGYSDEPLEALGGGAGFVPNVEVTAMLTQHTTVGDYTSFR